MERPPTTCATGSSCEIRIETLDFCFQSQQSALEVLVAQSENEDEKRCARQWLHVFINAPTEQKFARNCLATLMQEQLVDMATLSNIFLDHNNFGKNLNEVLQEVDRECDALSNSFACSKSDDCMDPMKHWLEKQSEQSHPENELLHNELAISRATIMKQQMVINALETEIKTGLSSNINSWTLSASPATPSNTAMKNIIDSIARFLRETQERKLLEDGRLRLGLFEKVCGWLSDEPWFTNQIGVFDVTFEQILQNHLEAELMKAKNALANNATKAFQKIHYNMKKKYKRRLSLQRQKFNSQLGFVKLEIFSKIRRAFVGMQSEIDPHMWKVLQELETKYEEIANQVIENVN